MTNIENLIEVMNELYSRESELKSELKKVQDSIKEIEYIGEEELRKQNKDVITVGYWSFGWKTSKRSVFNSKAFQKDHSDLYDKYKEEKEYRKFCFGHIDK